MVASRDEILQAALGLPEADRLVIANRLLDTLPADAPGLAMDDPALARELDRRSGQWENSVPWEELRSQFENTE